jgi:hypothetical protein
MQPTVRYTDGDPQIAYQVLGDKDLVFAFDWVSNLDLILIHSGVRGTARDPSMIGIAQAWVWVAGG